MDTSYVICGSDRVVSTGGSWDEFAFQNDGENAASNKVIGHTLWDFINGSTARSYLNAIFFSCRTHFAVYRSLYRCDGPNQKRIFEMAVEPLADDALRISSTLIQEIEWRRSGKQVEILPASKCSVCCCYRLPTEQGGWIDPFSDTAPQFLPSDYLVCSSCKQLAVNRLEKLEKKSA